MTCKLEHLVGIRLFVMSALLLVGPASTNAALLQSRFFNKGGETFYLLAFGPQQSEPQAADSLERAALKLGMEGLIDAYKANEVIGRDDSEMVTALREAARETNALSLMIFKRERRRGKSVAGKLVAMIRAYLPDARGTLALERKVIGLGRTLSDGERSRLKVELGNFFIDKRVDNRGKGRWLWRVALTEVRDLLSTRIDAHTVVLAQTSKGKRESAYRLFYGFNERLLEYSDPLIKQRTSVVVKTTGASLLDRLAQHVEKQPTTVKTMPLSARRAHRLFTFGTRTSPCVAKRRR